MSTKKKVRFTYRYNGEKAIQTTNGDKLNESWKPGDRKTVEVVIDHPDFELMEG